MRVSKWVCGISLISLGFGAVAFYAFHGIGGSGESSLASKTASNKRNLELPNATNTTTKVEDEPSVMMNDPAIAQAWGIHNVGALKAWALTKGNKNIVVAVIDTGCDIHHEDLQANIWINPGESGKDSNGRDKSNNGIDDDENGFVDDVHGWNFVSNNGDLTDNHGHGTHISGIIGAEAGNGKGIAGISPDVSIMCLKYFDPKVPNTDNLRNTVNSIRYARLMHAQIINYSGGGTEFSQDEHDAIEDARKAGILFVAAAGNERSNSDVHHYYPADYGLPNIISVTAVDPNQQILPSSNYGAGTVDIAAPGQNILSLLPNNSYGYMTGTSQATAFVTGAAVLVMARRGITDPEQVKRYIISTGDAQTQLLNKTATYRRLNLYQAVVKEDIGISASGGKAFGTEKYESGKFEAQPNDISFLNNDQKLSLEIKGVLEKQMLKQQMRAASKNGDQ
jgi:thermitase